MLKPQKFWHGSIWNFSGTFYQKIINYTYHLLIVRFFGAPIYGLFALTNSIFRISTKVGLLGSEKGSVYFVTKFRTQNEDNKINEFFKFLFYFFLTSGTLISLIIFKNSDFLSRKFFKKEYLEIFLWGFSLGFPFYLLSEGWGWATRGFETMKFFNMFIRILRPTFQFIFLIILFFSLKNFLAIPFSYSLSAISVAALFFLVIIKNLKRFKSARLDKKIIFAFISFNLPIFFAELSGEAMRWVDIIMLGFFKTSSDVGYYNAAARTSEFLLMFPWAFSPAFAPICAKAIHQKDMKILIEYFHKTLLASLILALPLLYFFYLKGGYILSIIFLPEFSREALTLKLLGTAQILMAFQGPFTLSLTMSGNQKLWAKFVFFSFLLNILLNYLLIPIFSTKGAALATATSLSFLAISSIFLVKMKLKLTLSQKILIPFIIYQFIIYMLLNSVSFIFRDNIPSSAAFLSISYLLSLLYLVLNKDLRNFLLGKRV